VQKCIEGAINVGYKERGELVQKKGGDAQGDEKERGNSSAENKGGYWTGWRQKKNSGFEGLLGTDQEKRGCAQKKSELVSTGFE